MESFERELNLVIHAKSPALAGLFACILWYVKLYLFQQLCMSPTSVGAGSASQLGKEDRNKAFCCFQRLLYKFVLANSVTG